MKFNKNKDKKLENFLNFFNESEKNEFDSLFYNVKDIQNSFEKMIKMTEKLDQVYNKIVSQNVSN